LIEWIATILMVVGTAFILVSSIGLARLPDFYTRMHGPTKAATLGVGFILGAASLHFTAATDHFSIRELLAIAFIFITAPVGAHMLAKAGRAKGLPFDKNTTIEK